MAFILLVEDTIEHVNTLVRSFELEGYTVDTAKDGQEGLDKIRRYSYDVVIVDMMLPPEIDGMSLIKQIYEIKKSAMSKRPQVIAITGQPEYKKIPQATEAMRNGAFDYLIKASPDYDYNERLLSRVREAVDQLDKSSEVAKPKVNLIQNSQGITEGVLIEGEPLDLGPKELFVFDCLAYAAPHGHIRSSDAIAYYVNDQLFNSGLDDKIDTLIAENVKGTVARIKRKLSKPKFQEKGIIPDSFIEGVHRTGYRMNASVVSIRLKTADEDEEGKQNL